MEISATGGDLSSKGTTTTAIATTATTTATTTTTTAPKPSSRNTGGPIRLSSVQGYETRTNDIIYCPPLEKVYVKEGKELQNHAIVYFGGDIQVTTIGI